MREFVIDRSKWRCGGGGVNAIGEGDTALLNNEGFMCCLGQIACQLKWPKANIQNNGSPNDCRLDGKKVNKSILLQQEPTYDEHGIWTNNTVFASKAMDINDDEDTTLKEKEKQLKVLARENDLRLTFVGRSVKHN